jgi:DNA-binding transcriptional LysR family regulator
VTFRSQDRRVRSIPLGEDELVAIVHPAHPFARKPKVTVAEWAREPIVFHNDPSPARERAIHLAEKRNTPLNVRIAVPTIDGIKLAVEMGLGVSLLPRRCVNRELQRKELVAVPIPELCRPREVRLIYRSRGALSHAVQAFLEVAAGNDGAMERVRSKLVAEVAGEPGL